MCSEATRTSGRPEVRFCCEAPTVQRSRCSEHLIRIARTHSAAFGRTFWRPVPFAPTANAPVGICRIRAASLRGGAGERAQDGEICCRPVSMLSAGRLRSRGSCSAVLVGRCAYFVAVIAQAADGSATCPSEYASASVRRRRCMAISTSACSSPLRRPLHRPIDCT